MKKRKSFLLLGILLFSFLFFPANRVSASIPVVEVPLTVKQSFEMKNAKQEVNLTGTYELHALDKNVPMPEQSNAGIYTFVLKGEQAETTMSLRYSHAGIYRYQLLQKAKNNESYQYDKTCYDITVYIKNGDAGQLIPQVVVENGDGKKCGELHFQNRYQGKAAEAPVKTGDQTNIWFYMCIGTGALFVMIAVSYLKKRKFV